MRLTAENARDVRWRRLPRSVRPTRRSRPARLRRVARTQDAVGLSPGSGRGTRQRADQPQPWSRRQTLPTPAMDVLPVGAGALAGLLLCRNDLRRTQLAAAATREQAPGWPGPTRCWPECGALHGTTAAGLSPQKVRNKSATATVPDLAQPRQPHSTALCSRHFREKTLSSADPVIVPLQRLKRAAQLWALWSTGLRHPLWSS